MSNPLVTIIIPTYNLEVYINETLKSVLRQTYKNLEIIVVDDGSKDQTVEICTKTAEGDQRVRIIKQRHKGVSAARNNGIEQSKGEYIAFIDGDDIIAPFYIETLMNQLSGHILSECFSKNILDYNYVFENEKDDILVISAQECMKRLLTGRYPVSVWGCIFRRNAIGEIKFPEKIGRCEDKHFLFHYLLKNESGSVSFNNNRMYGRCIREGSVTFSTWNISEDIIWVSDDIHEAVMKTHQEWKGISENNRFGARISVLKAFVLKGQLTDVEKILL